MAPNNPDVLTLVQIDALLVNITLNAQQAAKLQIDETVAVRFLDNGARTTGKISFISPVTDAESGTVLVKIRVENPKGRFRSGARCKISLPK